MQRLFTKPLVVGAMLGALGLILFAALAGAIVVGLGAYDASATSPHGRIAYFLIHATMVRSTHVRAPRVGNAPPLDADAIRQGAMIYVRHCEVCHGGPGVSRAHWADGLDPGAPYLLDAPQRWSPQQLRFMVGNGVKMTAMPAWRMSLDDRQLWSVVAFLELLPKLDRAQYLRMTRPPRQDRQAKLDRAQ